MSASAIGLDATAAFGVARSFSGRKWILQKADDDAVREFARATGISLTLGLLLTSRGVKTGDVGDVLNPTLKRLLPEPNSLLDMERAVARACAAIENGERIVIFGDYD